MEPSSGLTLGASPQALWVPVPVENWSWSRTSGAAQWLPADCNTNDVSHDRSSPDVGTSEQTRACWASMIPAESRSCQRLHYQQEVPGVMVKETSALVNMTLIQIQLLQTAHGPGRITYLFL